MKAFGINTIARANNEITTLEMAVPSNSSDKNIMTKAESSSMTFSIIDAGQCQPCQPLPSLTVILLQ
jgi:hypothetical protein